MEFLELETCSILFGERAPETHGVSISLKIIGGEGEGKVCKNNTFGKG
jgi:hypothetical protein